MCSDNFGIYLAVRSMFGKKNSIREMKGDSSHQRLGMRRGVERFASMLLAGSAGRIQCVVARFSPIAEMPPAWSFAFSDWRGMIRHT